MSGPDLWARLTDSSKTAFDYAAAYRQMVEFDSQQKEQQTTSSKSKISATELEIHSENLILGILDALPRYSEPHRLLEHLGLSRNTLEESLRKAGGIIMGEQPNEPLWLTDMPELSVNSRNIVETALKLAEEFNQDKDKAVNLKDLFGGILLVEESTAHRALAEMLGATPISMAQLRDSYPEFLAGGPSDYDYKEFLEKHLPLPLEKPIDTSLKTIQAHEKHVRALAVTRDGRLVISGSSDGTLKVWNLESYKQEATLRRHKDVVFAVVVTMDGRRAISGSADKKLKVWDLESYKEITTITGHNGDVHALDVTRDGRLVISGSSDGELKVWDLESYKEITTLPKQEYPIWTVAVTPDGQRVISGGIDSTLRVWDLKSSKEVAALPGHENIVTVVVVTKDGKRAISGSGDKKIKIWDLESYKEIETLAGHDDIVNSIVVTADGQRAISGSADRKLKVWDLKSYKEIATLSGHQAFIYPVAVTPDGRRAITGSYDGTIKVWDVTAFMPPRETVLSAKMLDDRPLDGENIKCPDSLGYSAYAAAIFQLIMKGDTSLPLSLAISAPWGYGKTSIMNWVKNELDNHRVGNKHKCCVVPNFPGRPIWPARRLNNRANPAAAQAEKYAREQLDLVRCCKTVCIDAWRYESSAALWAAFTKEIYQQGQKQLGGRLERLKFRLTLANSAPGDEPSGSWLRITWAVFKNNYGKVIGVLLAGLVVGFGFYLGLKNISEAESVINSFIAVITGLIGSIGGFIAWIKGLVRQPFSFNLDKVTAATVGRPEPVDGVDALCDVKRLVELLAPGKEDALVVFIDDLDRCSPDKIKDAIEVINLLFHGSKEGKTVFVLGMDAVMVAASLQVAYGEMIAELKSREHPAGIDFGHRFLGKICQLSFNLPEPRPTAMKNYLGGLLETSAGSIEAEIQEAAPVKPVAISPERKEEINVAVLGKRNPTQRLKAVEEVVNKAPKEEREAVAEAALELAKGENLKELSKDSPELQEAIRDGAEFLTPRPRDYKRFINAVRLQLLVSYQIRTFDSSRKWAKEDEIAKWTALCIRWPVLAEELRKHRGLLQEIEEWASKKKNVDPPAHWQKRIRDLATDPGFKDVFKEKPLLGAADLHGLLIVQ